jgi:large subunit ribosomal protein L29
MRASKLTELTTNELIEQEKELKTELFNLRFRLATGQLQNTVKIAECKRDIARVKTVLRQRELKAAE